MTQLVRIIRGPHAGRDGKLLSASHGVCEIESWLDREEILIVFEGDIQPIIPCPADQLEATLHRLAGRIRLCAQELADAQRGASECGELEVAKEIWGMRNRLLAIAEDVS